MKEHVPKKHDLIKCTLRGNVDKFILRGLQRAAIFTIETYDIFSGAATNPGFCTNAYKL